MNAITNMGNGALAELRALLGDDSVLSADADTETYLIDQLRNYRGRALAVVLPRSTEQVVAVVDWCREHRVAIVPQGGNTGYCGGATPDESGREIVLALQRMNRVRAVNAADFSMTVEAGCVLAKVQQAAAEAGRFFPLSLGSQGSCQIGGNLATNAGGVNVLRYGMTRELVLGVEAVLPDGSIYNGLSALRKDNTGYNLGSLLIGSEGTLAVITAATLKLWPQMRSTATAFVAVTSAQAAIELLGMLRTQVGDRLNSFEYLPRSAVQLACEQFDSLQDPFESPYESYLLIEISSAGIEDLDDLLQTALTSDSASELILDAVLATSERQRQAFWHLREKVPEAQRRAGASLKYDVSVQLSQLPAFLAQVSEWVSANVPEGFLVCYGHAGDGNLHCNISQRSDAPLAGFLAREPAIKRRVHDMVKEFGGSISAEHGIGQQKVEELERYASPVKLELMRRLKHTIDPLGIMNPGKVLRI